MIAQFCGNDPAKLLEAAQFIEGEVVYMLLVSVCIPTIFVLLQNQYVITRTMFYVVARWILRNRTDVYG